VTRIFAVVEGPTEEVFVKDVLAPVLWPRQVYLTPILLGVPGHKGGQTNYARVKKDILTQLKQDRAAYCTTMLDLYGLGKGFPGTPTPPNVSNLEKVAHIERAVLEDIIGTSPDLGADIRFVPYLQLHEYEGLLFSDPAAFAHSIFRPDLADRFQAIREAFATPEDINNDPNTAPSKRVLQLCSSYNKPLDGKRAASAVGIATIRRECPHFRAWLERLESLGGS
jgi:Domain of unknown function (DUF4276)